MIDQWDDNTRWPTPPIPETNVDLSPADIYELNKSSMDREPGPRIIVGQMCHHCQERCVHLNRETMEWACSLCRRVGTLLTPAAQLRDPPNTHSELLSRVINKMDLQYDHLEQRYYRLKMKLWFAALLSGMLLVMLLWPVVKQ
jgi:hypothetical protein